MTQVMVRAVLRRVVFNNRIEQAFNRCGVGQVPRSQADPLGVKEVLVMAPQLEMRINFHAYFLISTNHAIAFRSLNTTRSGVIPHSPRFDNMLSRVHLADQKPSAVATNRDPGGVTTCCPVFS